MKLTSFVNGQHTKTAAIIGLVLLVLGGCSSPEADFRLNVVYANKKDQEIDKNRQQEVANILVAMFGTPDEPQIVPGSGMDAVVSYSNLWLASGPVGKDDADRTRGLYRQHCVHCHGISGDGAGPTAAFLNPYPRDYRMGMYKFASTAIGVRPTDEDLHRILIEGVSGTAMPSFRLLDEDERHALVDYVKYLSIRGEVERLLMYEAADIDEEEKLDTSRDFLVDSILADVLSNWQSSATDPVEPPTDPNMFGTAASIKRGKELFLGEVATCSKCHGVTQLGDGQTTDFDTWTLDAFGKDVATIDEPRKAELMALGAMKPRNIIPRNLRQGIFRGGSRRIDIYRRIRHGIEGTPMPAAAMQMSPGAVGLTNDDLWHLVDFVQSLPYAALSQPGPHTVENPRVRN